MPSVERTAYRRFSRSLTAQELSRFVTPTRMSFSVIEVLPHSWCRLDGLLQDGHLEESDCKGVAA
jgi:hypothetical protein